MITRIGFAPRRAGMDILEFQSHWGGRHGDLAGALAGLTRYWQNHAVLANGEPLLPWPGFDACSDIDFPSVQAMNAAFAAEHYRVAVRADEERLVDKANGGLIVARRMGEPWTSPGVGIRLLTFLRLAPGRAKGELAAALTPLVAAPGVLGRELFLALDPAEAEGLVSQYDAVDIQWFGSADAAKAFVIGEESRLRRARLGALVRGVDQLLASVRVIV